MKKLIICTLFSLLSTASLAGELPTCASDPNDFTCFKTNLSSIYNADYHLFWEQWRNFGQKATSCTSLEQTKNFLTLVAHVDGELAEAYGETAEGLALSNPQCFLSAVEQLESDLLNRTISSVVFRPLFHSCTEMASAIEKAISTGSYPKVESVFAKKGCGS